MIGKTPRRRLSGGWFYRFYLFCSSFTGRYFSVKRGGRLVVCLCMMAQHKEQSVWCCYGAMVDWLGSTDEYSSSSSILRRVVLYSSVNSVQSVVVCCYYFIICLLWFVITYWLIVKYFYYFYDIVIIISTPVLLQQKYIKKLKHPRGASRS